eukprot:1247259-Pyramimonas_sp.AAC.1
MRRCALHMLAVSFHILALGTARRRRSVRQAGPRIKNACGERAGLLLGSARHSVLMKLWHLAARDPRSAEHGA